MSTRLTFCRSCKCLSLTARSGAPCPPVCGRGGGGSFGTVFVQVHLPYRDTCGAYTSEHRQYGAHLLSAAARPSVSRHQTTDVTFTPGCAAPNARYWCHKHLLNQLKRRCTILHMSSFTTSFVFSKMKRCFPVFARCAWKLAMNTMALL